MNERQNKAWRALDIGPVWRSKGAPVWKSDEPPVRNPEAPPVRSWAELREQVLRCQQCALARGRTQVVFGSGSAPASWMVIGEAPGEQEDLKGVPFVGPAGQLLDQMLAAIKVDRAREVFVANVLKCRPPRNRDPQADEIAQCSPWLHAQIASVQPRIILAVGRFAAQTLLQTDTPIGKLRGTVHRLPRPGATESSMIPLVVTYHPSYLLRSPAEKGKAWQDLLLAKSLMD